MNGLDIYLQSSRGVVVLNVIQMVLDEGYSHGGSFKKYEDILNHSTKKYVENNLDYILLDLVEI